MTLPGRAAALALLASCVAAACAPPDHGLEVALRFIPDEPTATLEPHTLLDRETVAEWPFDSADEIGAWTDAGDPGRLVAEGDGALFRSTARQLRIGRRVRLDARDVDAIELDAEHDALEGPELRWAREGERYSGERSVEPWPGPLASRERRTLSFRLRGHPEWTGEITRLQLRFRNPRDRPTRIYSVRAVAESPNRARLAKATGRHWKVGLGGDTRNALLGLPGSPIERNLTVPEGAELRFAYAVEGASPQSPVFRVTASRADAEPRLLFQASPPRDAGSAVEQSGDAVFWHEHRVDLGDLAGDSVTLRLEALPPGGASSADALAFWGHPEVLRPREQPRPPSVVLIVIDTLRADALSLYGAPPEASPRIDAWARANAAVFTEAVAAAPWTLPSHASMLSGIDAHRHGAGITRETAADVLMAAEILREAGYATVAITGGGFLDPRFGFGRGFDVYRHWRAPDRHLAELSTHVDQALAALDDRSDRPFFLLFHTYEVHAPYRARPPLLEASDPEETIDIVRRRDAEGLVRDFYLRRGDDEPRLIEGPEAELPPSLYASGVAYTDLLVGKLLDRLGEADLSGHTIVAITSDHGESLGEEGLAGHGFLHDSNLLVPLLIASPDGLGAGQRIEEQVRGVDLLPTLLELAGLAAPVGIDGVSLVPALRGESGTVPRTALSYSRHFGLSARLRGGETAQHPDWTVDAGSGQPETDPAERDAALARQLRALGYVD